MNSEHVRVRTTKVDFEAVAEFLEEAGTAWRRDIATGDADALVELAGRVCYWSFGERQSLRSNSEYVQNLVAQGHESVLEHATWTILLTGVSRAFTHQLVRHRVGFSFSQLSQQYAPHDTAPIVEPPEIAENAEAHAIWITAADVARDAYRAISKLLDDHPAPFAARKERDRARASAARSILPNATATTIVVTANGRSLRHFLRLRGAIEGDLEMRTISAEILEAVRQDAPHLFQDFSVVQASDGGPLVLFQPPS